MEHINTPKLDNLKRVMRDLGFSEVSIEDQIKELSDLIIASIVNKIAENNPDISVTNQLADESSIVKYLDESFNDESLKNIICEVSQEKISEYLAEILEDVDQVKRDEILSRI